MAGALASVLLQSMYTQGILNPDNVHLMGFSLGAHAAGFCGRHFENGTRKKLGRISGLDPAGLLFENENISLSSGDASFVDVIHANGGLMTELRFGRKNPMGHLDFYPNGGTFQPGCTGGLSDLSCSHNKAWWYFIESVKNETCSFRSIPCNDWYSYDICLSNNNSISANMGFDSIRAPGKGIYYLRTNSNPPYCISDEKPREGINWVSDSPKEKEPR
ncbi:hypothetical protein V5799_010720 [Amblyomma americanum]|uniref:Lipase domain-containing protein n=1 Tax=Amblyomma americanum TaxID=6943 RepID=A0AAQ4EJ33_AMBAM